MDSIINKLTEIESAASAIVQHAEVEKSALDEAETSRILSGQSQESQDELDALQKEYNEKHSDYAHEILRRITEV